jgi:hypothetical protein
MFDLKLSIHFLELGAHPVGEPLMSETELITAKYVRQAEEERQAREAQLAAELAAQPAEPQAPTPRQRLSAEQFARRLSYVVAGAAGVCVIALAIPFVASMGSHKRVHPIDWWLRLGGAGSDQTFERFIKDSLTANQQEFDQFKPAFDFDASSLNMNFQPFQATPPTRQRRK